MILQTIHVTVDRKLNIRGFVAAHGMPDEALQVVFRSVVIGRLLYASCAWSGFVTATDRESTPSSGVVNAADSVHRIWCHTMICQLRPTPVSLAEYLPTVYMFCMIFCRNHQLPRSIIASVSGQFRCARYKCGISACKQSNLCCYDGFCTNLCCANVDVLHHNSPAYK